MKNTPRTEIFETFAIQGMTLRDYFAAKALQLYVGNGNTEKDVVAKYSYELADAMMKARNNAT